MSVGATLWVLLFSNSCANTTTPPSGGPKDTIPPVIRKVDPLEGATMVPVKKTKITFTFNEYVVVKDPSCIYLSPPLEKRPKYRIHNKSLIVTFESDLDSNRTYTLDLTGAVADNNEGNMFPGYTYVFSTGSTRTRRIPQFSSSVPLPPQRLTTGAFSAYGIFRTPYIVSMRSRTRTATINMTLRQTGLHFLIP